MKYKGMPKKHLTSKVLDQHVHACASAQSDQLIALGLNDTLTLVGHFMSSPREREKRDRRDSRADEREGQQRKRKMNESEETEEIITSSHYPYLLQAQQGLPNCKPISVGRPSDVRHSIPLLHPTIPTV